MAEQGEDRGAVALELGTDLRAHGDARLVASRAPPGGGRGGVRGCLRRRCRLSSDVGRARASVHPWSRVPRACGCDVRGDDDDVLEAQEVPRARGILVIRAHSGRRAHVGKAPMPPRARPSRAARRHLRRGGFSVRGTAREAMAPGGRAYRRPSRNTSIAPARQLRVEQVLSSCGMTMTTRSQDGPTTISSTSSSSPRPGRRRRSSRCMGHRRPEAIPHAQVQGRARRKIVFQDITRRGHVQRPSEVWRREVDMYSTVDECVKLSPVKQVRQGGEAHAPSVAYATERGVRARDGCLFLECSERVPGW